MESVDFKKLIQTSNKRRMIVPAIFSVFVLILFSSFSVKNWIFPLRINDIEEAESAYESNQMYVFYNAKRLLYTGIEHKSRGKVDGYYYYSLENGRCRYFLVESHQKAPQPVLENYAFHGRLIQQEELASNLDILMAQMLDWTTDGVDSVSSELILSEIYFDEHLLMATVIVMFVSLAVALIRVLALAYGIFDPYGALNFRHLGNKNEREGIIRAANQEYNDHVMFMSQGMYVTDNYFIYYDADEFEIVPLEDIVWAYKHSSLRWTIGVRHFITYNMRLVTVYHMNYVFHGKTKESCDGLLEIIAEKHPEILIGYSQEIKAKIIKKIV